MKFINLIPALLLLVGGLALPALSAQAPDQAPAPQLAPKPEPQTQTKSSAPDKEKKIFSPFQEDAEERAKAEAEEAVRMQEEKAAAEAAANKVEARRMAIQMAVAPIKVLARGIQRDKSVALLALDGTRRIMIAKGDTLSLNTTAGAVEFKLTTVTKQSLTFELSDGTQLTIQ